MAKYSLDEQAWGTAVWLVLKNPGDVERLGYAIRAYRGVAMPGHPAVKLMEAQRDVLRGDLDEVPAANLAELRRRGRLLGLLPAGPPGQLQVFLLSSK